MSADETEMSMLFSFPDQSASFCYGFEAGKLWAAINDYGEATIDRGFTEGLPIRHENLLLVQRMAAVRNYTLETKDVGHGWVGIRLTYSPKPKPQLRAIP